MALKHTKNKPDFTHMDTHTTFMKVALQQARKAFDAQEVPVGAIIVDPEGRIIARAYNQVEQKQTQTAHAELLALAKAGKKYGWRLDGCWIYVTLEPCSMCMHAIRLSRMSGVVYGATSPVFGYQLDKCIKSGLYLWAMNIISGVCAEQATQILKSFFKSKRSVAREWLKKSY